MEPELADPPESSATAFLARLDRAALLVEHISRLIGRFNEGLKEAEIEDEARIACVTSLSQSLWDQVLDIDRWMEML